jgi:spore germination protein YaaH
MLTGFGASVLLIIGLSQCLGTPGGKSATNRGINADEEFESTLPIILPPNDAVLPVSAFGEIWGYVIAGREDSLTKNLPLSDIGYFGAEIDSYGKLTDVPARRRITFQGRVHMVVACNSRSLTHFVLLPGSAERRNLIADLLAAAKNYDGLQIDFENIPARDGEAFLSFLKELRAGLGNKIFSVALPARVRKIADDINDYEKIAPIVDRVLVMAYDEHWSGSTPGSVASLSWCSRVAEYALRVIGREKLVMGLPFYGRAWGDHNPSRALIYPTIERLIREREVTDIRRENGIPVFNYEIPVSVKVYFEDEYSLSVRMELYKSLGVTSIGFWRIGQETPRVWKLLRLDPALR